MAFKKYTMFKIIQIVNIWDIFTTYAFYKLAWREYFTELSPFFNLLWWNIYAFLVLKYILLVIISIWIYKLFSEKYFMTFYMMIYILYSFAIANNIMAYAHFQANLLGK